MEEELKEIELKRVELQKTASKNSGIAKSITEVEEELEERPDQYTLAELQHRISDIKKRIEDNKLEET